MNDEVLLHMENQREDRAFFLAIVRMCVTGVVLIVASMAGCEVAVKSLDPCGGQARNQPAWCHTSPQGGR